MVYLWIITRWHDSTYRYHLMLVTRVLGKGDYNVYHGSVHLGMYHVSLYPDHEWKQRSHDIIRNISVYIIHRVLNLRQH